MTQKISRYTTLLGGLLAVSASMSAFAVSPVGFWKTIDDKTKNPKGIMHIYANKSGKLVGQIIGGFKKEGAKSAPNCTKCSNDTYDANTGYGIKKNEAKLGKIIMWNYTKDDNKWTGGSIVDTSTGKKYRSDIALASKDEKINPNILDVTGKVFIFSRTQQWYRIADAKAVKKLCTKGSTKGFVVNCEAQYK